MLDVWETLPSPWLTGFHLSLDCSLSKRSTILCHIIKTVTLFCSTMLWRFIGIVERLLLKIVFTFKTLRFIY